MSTTEEEQAAGKAVAEIVDDLSFDEPTEDGPIRAISPLPDTRALGQRFLRELEYQGYKITRDR